MVNLNENERDQLNNDRAFNLKDNNYFINSFNLPAENNTLYYDEDSFCADNTIKSNFLALSLNVQICRA